jgi:hypothetical protein
MLVKIGATLFLILASMSIGFGVYGFEHRQVTDSLLLFILGLVALNFAASLFLVSIVSPIEGWLAELFKELEGFHKDVIEIRDSFKGWEVKVARHDDLLEIRETLEEMKTEVTDRSDLIEKAVMKFLARHERTGGRNPKAG